MQASRLVDSRVLVPSVQRVMAEHMPQLAGGRGLRLDDAASATSMAAFDGVTHTILHVQCMCSTGVYAQYGSRLQCMGSMCAPAVRVQCVCSACARVPVLVPPQPQPQLEPQSSFWPYPGAVIAPMMGCDSATDYYTQASSGPLLTRARVSTAC